MITADFLVRIDIVCSLAAARGIDDETREELRQIALDCRRLYERIR